MAPTRYGKRDALEAQVVRLIQSLHLEGCSAEAIAAHLNFVGYGFAPKVGVEPDF